MFRRFSFLFGLAVLSSLVAAASYRGPLWREENFRFEALLGVAMADLDADTKDELILVGRNYLDREVAIEVLGWQDGSFTVEWRSPNLIETQSSLLAFPLHRPDGPPVLVAVTRSRFLIFGYHEGIYTQLGEGPMELAAEEGAAGDLDGDGQDELVVSTTLRNTKNGREKNLRVLAFSGDRLRLTASSMPVGNIRAVAVGDLDGDGRAEAVAEAGITTKPGEFFLFSLAGEQLSRLTGQKTSLPAAAYGLTVGRWTGSRHLLAASSPGRLVAYRWTGKELAKAGEMVLKGNPLGLAGGDLDGDGRPELAVITYPATLQIFIATD